jgi:DsbC/DsbD-like thiol-disulfide interchange protein
MPVLSVAHAVLAVTAVALATAPANPAPDPAKLLAASPSATIEHETPHLSLRASVSPETIAPGGRLSIAVDVRPKPGMHVYAPGSPYRAVVLALKRHPLLHVHDTEYPEPALYLFKPLNEAVLVYSEPFRLSVDVTAGRTAGQRAKLRKQKTVPIAGSIEYQACDDRVCYLPVSIPISWEVRVTR